MSVNGPISPKQCYYEMDYSLYSFYWLDSLEIRLDHNSTCFRSLSKNSDVKPRVSHCDSQNLQYKTHPEFWPSHRRIFKTSLYYKARLILETRRYHSLVLGHLSMHISANIAVSFSCFYNHPSLNLLLILIEWILQSPLPDSVAELSARQGVVAMVSAVVVSPPPGRDAALWLPNVYTVTADSHTSPICRQVHGVNLPLVFYWHCTVGTFVSFAWLLSCRILMA